MTDQEVFDLFVEFCRRPGMRELMCRLGDTPVVGQERLELRLKVIAMRDGLEYKEPVK